MNEEHPEARSGRSPDTARAELRCRMQRDGGRADVESGSGKIYVDACRCRTSRRAAVDYTFPARMAASTAYATAAVTNARHVRGTVITTCE
jgi:hypothetical protein